VSHLSGRKNTKLKPIRIAAWNVRTLLDNPTADRPERRTALLCRELARYRIDIAALSETRFSEEGQLTERGADYTIFWRGRPAGERREAGVGFAVKNDLVKKLDSLPRGLNDRIMTLRLPTVSNKAVTIISVYAPTMTNPDDVKAKFYEDLHATVNNLPRIEKIFLLGDFNARVGSNHETWGPVIGKHGIGKCNSNGELLLQFCSEHQLLITNTIFRLPTRNKTTWMHPRSHHWHLIDYIITKQQDRQDVKVTKSMCGADCWTDHRLVISKVQLHVLKKRRPQGQKPHKRLNVCKLNCEQTSQRLLEELEVQASNIQITDEVEESWKSFRDIIFESCLNILGNRKRHHQDWFDQNDAEIAEMLDEKHRLLTAYLSSNTNSAKEAFARARRRVQSRLREMQDSWLLKKAEEIQSYADNHRMKEFYSAVKEIYGPQTSGSAPIYDAEGSTLLTDKKMILQRWAEHFEAVLNRPSEINQDAINRLPQVPPRDELDRQPSLQELVKAIKQLSNGKAPGADGIPAEVFKHIGQLAQQKLLQLFQLMWVEGTLPQDFKDASVIHLYKKKGNRHICDNHRGISLLCIAGKLLARILLNRLINHLEQGLLPESQCGFRKDRGTIDMIFAARQLQEKCQEHNSELYCTFVDLTKAFDTVSRAGLWQIMKKFGCPDHFTHMIRQFHEGMMAQVCDQNETSNQFHVSNGVKQGCVLAPTLFSLMFSAMLHDAFCVEKPGLDVRYRTDGGLFNLRRRKSTTKCQVSHVCDLLFADDCALNASNAADMQRSMDLFSKACKNFGLTISTKKTEVIHQPAPGKQSQDPGILVNGERLKCSERFVYLGSTLSIKVNIDEEVDARIAKASSSFGRLRDPVWERKGITIKTKIAVYRAIVLTTLLYGAESWTIYRRHEKQLNRFHLNCLRRLLRIRWQDHIPDTEVLERSKMPSIMAFLRRTQLRWAGHVLRMPDSRLPKQLLFGELTKGKRSQGGQKKRFKDSLKATMKDAAINPDQWEGLARDRPKWRSLIARGANSYEASRIQEAKRKRAQRKDGQGTGHWLPRDVLTCPYCSRHFKARIGLISHLRTHPD
jgi:hypothetical protein